MSHEGQQLFERWHKHRTVLLHLQDVQSEHLTINRGRTPIPWAH